MLDTVMKANPKLTEAVTAASKRAAENGKGESQETAKTQTNGKGASAHNSATLSKYANRIPFGKNMKDYTIVAPQMSPIHCLSGRIRHPLRRLQVRHPQARQP